MFVLRILDYIWEKLTTIVAGVILVLLHTRMRSFRFLQLAKKVPGPSLWQLFTVHPKHLLSRRFSDELCKISLSYNNKPWQIWMGLHVIVISDPETIGIAFNSKYLSGKDELYKNITDFIGKNSLALDGSEWKLRRKINSHAFAKPLFEHYFDIMYEEAQKLAMKLKEYVVGEDIDIHRCVESAVVCFSFRFLGGRDFVVDEIISPDEFGNLMHHLLMAVRVKAINPSLFYVRKFQKNGREMIKKYEEFIHNLRKRIREERDIFLRKVSTEGKSPESALEFLLEAMNQNTFTEEEIVSEMFVLIIGAFEATTTVICSTLLLLALHPNIQHRVAEEIESVFGGSDRPIVQEDLSRLEYLERVIKESMRLFPPAPLLLRRASEDVDLNGILVPKGCSVAMDLKALHRNPHSFKDPMVMDPDRFAPGVEERHPYSFIPFSSGLRTCVGRSQAMPVVKTMLSTLLRNFRFLPGQELNSIADIKHEFSFMLHVRGNLVRVSPNENSFQ